MWIIIFGNKTSRVLDVYTINHDKDIKTVARIHKTIFKRFEASLD